MTDESNRWRSKTTAKDVPLTTKALQEAIEEAKHQFEGGGAILTQRAFARLGEYSGDGVLSRSIANHLWAEFCSAVIGADAGEFSAFENTISLPQTQQELCERLNAMNDKGYYAQEIAEAGDTGNSVPSILGNVAEIENGLAAQLFECVKETLEAVVSRMEEVDKPAPKKQ